MDALQNELKLGDGTVQIAPANSSQGSVTKPGDSQGSAASKLPADLDDLFTNTAQSAQSAQKEVTSAGSRAELIEQTLKDATTTAEVRTGATATLPCSGQCAPVSRVVQGTSRPPMCPRARRRPRTRFRLPWLVPSDRHTSAHLPHQRRLLPHPRTCCLPSRYGPCRQHTAVDVS